MQIEFYDIFRIILQDTYKILIMMREEAKMFQWSEH